MGRKDPSGESHLKKKRRIRIKELSQKGIYLLPNLFTTGNLFCGVFAILAVLNKGYINAVTAILVATLFDTVDGMLARLTKTTSRFGLEYDSLSDLVSFGVAPGLVVYSWGLSGYGRLGWAACFLYVACGALRLCRYNVQKLTSETDGFTGLPIPAAAAFIAALVLLDDYILHFGKEVRPVVILCTTYLLAFLMVSTLHYKGVKGIGFGNQIRFRVLVATILVLLVFVIAPQVTFFTLALFYICSGILEKPTVTLYRTIRKGPQTSRLSEEHRS